jgi:hypothetical protein
MRGEYSWETGDFIVKFNKKIMVKHEVDNEIAVEKFSV